MKTKMNLDKTLYEIMAEMWHYLENLNDEEYEELEKSMGIKKVKTPFGTLKYMEHNLFK